MSRESIYRDIDDERAAQDAKWGGLKHDDTHAREDWRAFILEQVGAYNASTFRRQMIRVAALAVAAVESQDRIAARAEKRGA